MIILTKDLKQDENKKQLFTYLSMMMIKKIPYIIFTECSYKKSL